MTNSQMIDEKINLVPFDPQWKEIYKSEGSRIQKKLGTKIIDMQHIGSTAIPNIYSKPIVDIMIGIENLESCELIIKELVELGYEYLGNANVPGRLYFRKRNTNNFNIALCRYQGDIWTNNLLFRDYLIKNPDIAENYSIFKKKTFDSGVDTLIKYSEVKRPFVEKILQNAKLDQGKKFV